MVTTTTHLIRAKSFAIPTSYLFYFINQLNKIKMHLDLMLLHQSAIANAIQRNDEFYTLTIGETTSHLMLPTPQECGTITQQRTYAMEKAQELLNTFGK